MLNLITGQVSHENNACQELQADKNPLKLSEITHKSVSSQIHSAIVPKSRQLVNIHDFLNQPRSTENYYYEHFLQVCYLCVVNRLTLSPTQHSQTFIESIQKFMPHWTPPQRDNIVYATIVEAMSSSVADIETYLLEIKKRFTHK